MPRPRDNQRSRLYAAEKCLSDLRVSKHAARHLIDTQTVSGWVVPDHTRPSIDVDGNPILLDGKPVYRSKPMKTPTVGALRAYVEAVTGAAWFTRRWSVRPRVIAGRGSHASRYGWDICVSQHHRRSEAVILHEIAHTLIGEDCADHGPEFAGVLLFLVEQVMGKGHADTLRESYRAHRVDWTNRRVPEPAKAARSSLAGAAKRG